MRQSRCSFLNAWENTYVARAITISAFLRNTRWRHGRSRGETKYSALLFIYIKKLNDLGLIIIVTWNWKQSLNIMRNQLTVQSYGIKVHKVNLNYWYRVLWLVANKATATKNEMIFVWSVFDFLERTASKPIIPINGSTPCLYFIRHLGFYTFVTWASLPKSIVVAYKEKGNVPTLLLV